ncbi:MAG: SRPBCC family protein [Micromonosporaceae bacterium]
MADQPQLQDEVRKLVEALGQWALTSVTEKLGSVTKDVTQAGGGGGGGALSSAVTSAVSGGLKGGVPGALKEGTKGVVKGAGKSIKEAVTGGGGGGGGSSEVKVASIVESIDVGVPVKVAYSLLTQYADLPNFTKGLESVEVDDEEPQNLEWKAHVAFSHRTWQATVTEQVPDKRIVWTAKGNKGFVDGAVTFHELAPELTRILVVLEYHSQGFVEWVANRWRAVGRRARLDLKHFRRHAMTRTLLNPDEVEGWRGEIRDGEVVKDHETALREEREEAERKQREEDERAEHEEGEPEDREEPEDRDEGEDEDQDEDREPERARGRRRGRAREEPEDRDEDDEDEDPDTEQPKGRGDRQRAAGARRREQSRHRRSEEARRRSSETQRRSSEEPRRRRS